MEYFTSAGCICASPLFIHFTNFSAKDKIIFYYCRFAILSAKVYDINEYTFLNYFREAYLFFKFLRKKLK
ncbi:MAG TPA: hypothetical protein DD414_06780 [Lachnospiraceae bacterium]|nr:hypothetical protein [Lachnospiraceae bacterium]